METGNLSGDSNPTNEQSSYYIVYILIHYDQYEIFIITSRQTDNDMSNDEKL